MTATQDERFILLTGATGYVGGRLLRVLTDEGHRVRCLVRRPERLAGRIPEGAEIAPGDLFDEAALAAAMRGVHTAYYLIHSMGSSSDFEERDREGARLFGRLAAEAGVSRIIYLGGLGSPGGDLSSHLRSRHEVGRILRESGVPTVELRASIIIGSGSLSFEMIRALVQKLPVMITPRWVGTLAQPIAIEDVLAYLTASIDVPIEGDGIFEIGGADRVSYGDIMREVARQRGLRRWFLPVPVLTTGLSSRWLAFVTPVYAAVGRKLIDGVKNETVVTDDRARRVFDIRPRNIQAAVERALAHEDREFAETRWTDAISSYAAPATYGGERFGTRLVDSRARHLPLPPERVFAPVQRIGGRTGWYHANFLWRLRGVIDLLVGGPGMRRGRRHPVQLAVGDTLDCWRVESVEEDHLLGLRAEMKLPGRAWLQFEVTPEGNGSVLRQTAIFDPSGLSGLAYWYGIYPLHSLVFGGMLRGIAQAALAGGAASGGLSGREPGPVPATTSSNVST